MRICSVYARLFKYIDTYIRLYVVYVFGYSKGANHKNKKNRQKMIWMENNKINIFYHFDATWGEGDIIKGEFIKELSSNWRIFYCT